MPERISEDEAVRMAQRTVALNPAFVDNDPQRESPKFWDSSPTGEIKSGTVNRDAWQAFEIGKEGGVGFRSAVQRRNAAKRGS